MVSGWRRGGVRVLLGTRHQCAHQQVERSPIARQAVKVSALYIYLVPCTSSNSGVYCLAPKSMRKTIKLIQLIFTSFPSTAAVALLSFSLSSTITSLAKITTMCFYIQCRIYQWKTTGVVLFNFFGLAKIRHVAYVYNNACDYFYNNENNF